LTLEAGEPFTQYGEHHAVPQHLQGPRADKVVGVEGVALADEVLPGRAEGRLDVQRERAQAPPAGALEHGQLQDVLVQVHGDVRPQLIGEVMEELEAHVDMSIHQRHYMKPRSVFNMYIYDRNYIPYES